MSECPQVTSLPGPGSNFHHCVSDHDSDTLATELYATCTRMWSPRRTMRIDPERTNNYSRSVAIPAEAPTHLWAMCLTDDDHLFRLLAFDFDTSRHGPEQARTDSDRLAAHLDDLGVPYLRTHSGPTGGQHVWIRFADPCAADADTVRELARVLAQHYLTLDISPLSNAVTGAVRPPGAPHRHGGRSLPHLTGLELRSALERVSHGTTPEVITWLIARHPHTAPPANRARTTPIRILDTAANPRLDRPRRGLSERTRSLLATSPAPGADRSAVAYSILLGMARVGWSLEDVQSAVGTEPGLVRLREDRDRGRKDLDAQYQRALEQAATFAPTADRVRGPLDDDLDTIERALTTHSARFARPGGASDERILHALITLARTAGTPTLDIDCRRLAEMAGIDHTTVSRRLKALAQAGWVTQTHAAAGTRAATWTLNLPPAEWACTGATQVEHAPAPKPTPPLLDHHSHDIWSPTPGLGAAAARIHWVLLHGNSSPASISAVTGYSTRTVEKALRAFQGLRLSGTLRRSAETAQKALSRAAQALGVAGVAATRRAGHLLDRETFAWWTDDQAWRQRKGKKRGARRDTASMLALPIDGPARVKYGRFPTTGGRADYRTARDTVRRVSGIDHRAAA